MQQETAIAPLTQRQRNILSAAALREAAACYPDKSRPALAYWALAETLEAELGEVAVDEIETTIATLTS